MSDAERNRWVSYRDAIATWVVELPPDRDLTAWLIGAVGTLEEFPVWSVEQAPLIGYRRESDGPLGPFLARRAERNGVLELFTFSSYAPDDQLGGEFRVVGRMAWYDAAGGLATGLVAGVGELLAGLRPDDVLRAGGMMSPLPPLWITGPTLRAGEPAPRSVRVRLRIHSDLWLPWVHGFLDDASAVGSYFDNRELADQHAPALNAALASLGRSARELGGALHLDEDDTAAVAAGWVDDAGIRLDAAPPSDRQHRG